MPTLRGFSTGEALCKLGLLPMAVAIVVCGRGVTASGALETLLFAPPLPLSSGDAWPRRWGGREREQTLARSMCPGVDNPVPLVSFSGLASPLQQRSLAAAAMSLFLLPVYPNHPISPHPRICARGCLWNHTWLFSDRDLEIPISYLRHGEKDLGCSGAPMYMSVDHLRPFIGPTRSSPIPSPKFAKDGDFLF